VPLLVCRRKEGFSPEIGQLAFHNWNYQKRLFINDMVNSRFDENTAKHRIAVNEM
jgi:hypothetical protein